jgi:hypothetical protein
MGQEIAVAAMAFNLPSMPPEIRDLISLPIDQAIERIDGPTCRQIEALANAPLAPLAPATKDEILNHLEFMASVLPSKDVDLRTGKNRLAIYYRFLMEHPPQAIAHMARRACAEFDWFPTPKQCLALLDDWHHPDKSAKARLGIIAQRYRQARYDQLMRDIRDGKFDQAAIDAFPDGVKRAAETYGYLRRMDDGSYIWRAPMRIETGDEPLSPQSTERHEKKEADQ